MAILTLKSTKKCVKSIDTKPLNCYYQGHNCIPLFRTSTLLLPSLVLQPKVPAYLNNLLPISLCVSLYSILLYFQQLNICHLLHEYVPNLDFYFNFLIECKTCKEPDSTRDSNTLYIGIRESV